MDDGSFGALPTLKLHWLAKLIDCPEQHSDSTRKRAIIIHEWPLHTLRFTTYKSNLYGRKQTCLMWT